MGHLGSVAGDCRLRAEGKEAAGTISLGVYDGRGGLKFGSGTIECSDSGFLFHAVGKVIDVQMTDGRAFKVIIHRSSIGSGEAEVKSTGPIPGF